MLNFSGAEQRLKLTRGSGSRDEDYKVNGYSFTPDIKSMGLSSMEAVNADDRIKPL